MSKQFDTHRKPDKPDVTHRSQQTTTPEAPVGQFALADLMPIDSLMGTTGQPSIQSQANYLNNNQISLAQRQAMADRIANTQGNQHMVKVMRAMQSGPEKSPTSTGGSARPPAETSLFALPDLGEIDSFLGGSGPLEFIGMPDDGDNGAVNTNNGLVQTKLTVNEPGDVYEQEADAVADTVMRMDAVQDNDLGEVNQTEPIQRATSSSVSTPEVTPDVESSISSMQGGGEPLAKQDQSFFESRMGADFSNVRIHTDSNAAQTSDSLQAKAFTVENNIAFNKGQYQPGTDEGRHLIAHELTHVVQQGGAKTIAREPDDIDSEEVSLAETPEDLQDVASQRGVMDAELAEASSEDGVDVVHNEGEPALLLPTEEPEAPMDQATSQDQTENSLGGDFQNEATNFNQNSQFENQTNETQELVSASQTQDSLSPFDSLTFASTDMTFGELNEGYQTGITPPNPELIATASNVSDNIEEQSSPDALREALPTEEPELDEFLDAFEADRTTEEEKAEADQLVAGLQAEAEAASSTILAEAENQKTAMMTLAEEQITVIQTTLAEQTALIQELYITAQEELKTSAEQCKTDVITQVEEEITQVNTDTETKIAETEEQLLQRKTDFLNFITEQQQQPDIIAQAEISRANSELDAAANDAIAVGEAEAGRRSNGEAQGAARKVASDSAADIEAKKPAIAQDLQSRADEFAAKYPEYGQKISAHIDEIKVMFPSALREKSRQTIEELQAGREATLQAIDQKVEGEIQKLKMAETATLTKLGTTATQSTTEIQTSADETVQGIDSAAQLLVSQIEQTSASVQEVVSDEEEPNLAGVQDLVEGTRANLTELVSTGTTQFSEMVVAGSESITQIVTEFDTTVSEMVSTAQEKIAEALENANTAIDELVQKRQDGAQESIETLKLQQEEMVTTAFAELDPAIEAAEQEVLNLTEQFKTEITPATDKSIAEAKKPRTDPLESRVCEAADQAEESWLSGLFRAIVDIAVGLVVLVVVALVVAAIAAAFGVILTAWTAIMVAGAILLVIGLASSLYSRFTQAELAGEPWYKKVGFAVMDTVGLTGITQLITGKDIATGQELSAGERTYDGVMGTFTAISLGFGIRGAFKGPGAGGFTRSTGWRWVGWRRAIPEGFRGMRNVGMEMYTGIKMGVRNIGTWLKQRFGGNHQSVPGDANFNGNLPRRTRPLTETGRGHHMWQENAHGSAYPEAGPFSETTVPRFYPEGVHPNSAQNAGFAHNRLHASLRQTGVPGNRAQTQNANLSFHQIMDAYHQAYADPALFNIRGSVRTPLSQNVIAEGVSPSQGFNALLNWYGYGQVQPYTPLSGLPSPSEMLLQDNEQDEYCEEGSE